MKIDRFGIPFTMDEKTYSLDFSVKPKGNKEKNLKEMSHLFYNNEMIDETEVKAYHFYSEIYTERYKKVFERKGFTNGVTVIMPGSVNGECFKNSGHYHMVQNNQKYPNMEAYEILLGNAAFLLQKSTNLTEKELKIEDCVVIIAEEGEKIIVPPNYAHSVVNIGSGPMIFGNLASPCPLNYEPINKKNGFFTYVLKHENTLLLQTNSNYENLPKIRIVKPKEAKHLGIDFNKSLNECFYNNPDIFDYLNQPDTYVREVEKLIGVSE